ncbi:MAG: hypothetical protein QOI03_1858 [Solirubrobacteraceae bacterium]|nr:hypothetical protein [Solirubrobacteraceae bacterium]
MVSSSSTTPSSLRLLLRHSAPARAGRYRGAAAAAATDGLSSAAGLQARPWLTRLSRALAEDRFVLHFQPIVALGDGRIAHHEALLRLPDGPAGRLLAPAAFLPWAERHGLIAEIDRMVIARTVRLLAEQLGEHGQRIAVNVSARSVCDPMMLAHIEWQLTRHDVDPARLVIEITETAAISNMESARSFCAGVQSLGSAVALDDFGAGFGSFQYLKHLPFTYLKIDGEFIRGLLRSRTDQLVVKALVGVARGLGRLTIAEFVGDEETVGMLRSFGVDYAQGYELGRPQAALAVAA